MRITRETVIALTLVSTATEAATVAEQLLAGYERIESVSCDVRKDTEASAASAARGRVLSRVYYRRPDRLHVDNHQPLKRTIVADGTNFFSYVAGDPKGFSRPVNRLESEMLIGLRKVPGSAMDHLLRLRGIAETNLPPAPDLPVRRGYATTNLFAVLSLDATGRLARVELFADSSMADCRARCDYSRFVEAAPDVWLAALHQSTARMGGAEFRETSRFDNLVVNRPMAPTLFNPALFFKDVRFEDSFDKMYP